MGIAAMGAVGTAPFFAGMNCTLSWAAENCGTVPFLVASVCDAILELVYFSLILLLLHSLVLGAIEYAKTDA